MSSGLETGGTVAGAAVLGGLLLRVWDRFARRDRNLRAELWKEIDSLRSELRTMRTDHAIEIATLRAQHAQEVADLKLELNYWRELATTNLRRSS